MLLCCLYCGFLIASVVAWVVFVPYKPGFGQW